MLIGEIRLRFFSDCLLWLIWATIPSWPQMQLFAPESALT